MIRVHLGRQAPKHRPIVTAMCADGRQRIFYRGVAFTVEPSNHGGWHCPDGFEVPGIAGPYPARLSRTDGWASCRRRRCVARVCEAIDGQIDADHPTTAGATR